jgi:hypothetical protein
LDIRGEFLEKIANSQVSNTWKVDKRPTSASDFFRSVFFYIYNMESIGFTAKKNCIANFHVLGLFIPKNKYGAKKNPSVTRRCRPGVSRNLYRQYLSRLKGYRFEISAALRQFGWIDAPHTQNFEILKSLEQAQE